MDTTIKIDGQTYVELDDKTFNEFIPIVYVKKLQNKYKIKPTQTKQTKTLVLKSWYDNMIGNKYNTESFENEKPDTYHQESDDNSDYSEEDEEDVHSTTINKNIEYVYCITSELLNGVKIGRWKNSIKKLRDRYNTYYGRFIDIFYVRTLNSTRLEELCHTYFEKYRITNELFETSYLPQYKEFLLEKTDLKDQYEDIDDENYVNPNRKKEICPNCRQEFSRKQHLRRHIKNYCSTTDNNEFVKKNMVLKILDGSLLEVFNYMMKKEHQLEDVKHLNNCLKNKMKVLEEISHDSNCLKNIQLLEQLSKENNSLKNRIKVLETSLKQIVLEIEGNKI